MIISFGNSYCLLGTFSWFEGFSSHPKHVSGEMNSCVDVTVKVVMGLNPYLEEENKGFFAIAHQI